MPLPGLTLCPPESERERLRRLRVRLPVKDGTTEVVL